MNPKIKERHESKDQRKIRIQRSKKDTSKKNKDIKPKIIETKPKK